MWRVLFILTVLTASCEPYKKHKTTPSRNQRIIKVQGPPHYNNFYGHQKPVRKRPFGGSHQGDEFIRPNHPPPIPPFFNGPSTNHIKHLPRPPPHVFHKAPSYGLGFPYKTLSNYRPAITKDHFRIQSISTLPVRQSSSLPSASLSSALLSSSSLSSSSTGGGSISTSTTYRSPTFSSSSSSFASSSIPHIISSDDNNGPIREIPAPNLAPKPHGASFGAINVVADVGGIGGISGLGGIGGLEGGSGYGGVKIHGIGDLGGVGGVLHGVGDVSGGTIHGIGDISGAGVSGVGIHNVGSDLHGVSTSGGDDHIGSLTVGGVSHLEQESLLHTVGKNPTGVNLNSVVKGQGLEVSAYIKESTGDLTHGKGPTVEIANFDEGSPIDVTNLIKDAAGTSNHHSSYEVTEHNLPSNDQIIKGHDGTKLYYAPDPDPSLPVHKVPPTNDPHSTPSNGQNINSVYLPQISHGFPYLQGSSVGGHLSTQELFHLMHGYPAVYPQPVVAFVSQPQASGVILSGQNYYQHGGQAVPDISEYLQQPEIHNLLHNTAESHHEHDTIGGSHSSVVSQSVYSPQHQYESLKNSDTDAGTNSGNYPTSEIKHNYQYEPEASESDTSHSLTVIKQSNDGNLNSETVKELLLQDSVGNELNHRGKGTTESVPTILQLKNIPEVPFYATLPSKKAAEALASLQAAGSIASNYINRIKISRGDQPAEDEHQQERRGKFKNDGIIKGEGIQLESEKTVVEIQQSVPLYETSITAKNLVEDDSNLQEPEEQEEQDGEEEEEENVENDADFSSQGHDENQFGKFDFKEDDSNEAFGKRIRPK